MKIKLLIASLSVVLFVVFLAIDLRVSHDSVPDKWLSFGMGLLAPVFIASLASAIILYRKQKAV